MESFEQHFETLFDAIHKRMPGADEALIRRAVDYANEKHKSQKHINRQCGRYFQTIISLIKLMLKPRF